MSSTGRGRLASWLLARWAPEYHRESFLGDLLEQYDERGAGWYWRQILGVVRARMLTALWSATETHVPVAEFIGDLVLSIAMGIFGIMQFPVFSGLFIAGRPFIRSDMHLTILSVTMGTVLMGAAMIVHVLRRRSPRAPVLPAARYESDGLKVAD